MGQSSAPQEFANSQAALQRAVPRVLEERRRRGLDGLVGGLSAIYINTEPGEQQAALAELLRYTGLDLEGVYAGPSYITGVLKTAGSADVIVRSRRGSENSFAAFNDHPKSRHLPHTRLETLLFETPDIERYVAIQQANGVAFLTAEPIRTEKYTVIQTPPSSYTGTSTAFIQWRPGCRGDRYCSDMTALDWPLRKPANSHASRVHQLDHVTLRVRAEDRDAAILELMSLTNYDYDFSIYVESLNSITNVTRGRHTDPAVVMTSGIRPYVDDATSGPTEKYIHNHGPRAHHIAFWTDQIEATFAALQADGVEFLIELTGSPAEGLHQTFTQPSPHTLLVHEYIHRYGGFTGFFTKSNVTALTAATGKQ